LTRKYEATHVNYDGQISLYDKGNSELNGVTARAKLHLSLYNVESARGISNMR